MPGGKPAYAGAHEYTLVEQTQAETKWQPSFLMMFCTLMSLHSSSMLHVGLQTIWPDGYVCNALFLPKTHFSLINL
jgi:hypothetical protein